MPDTKLSAMTAAASLADADLLYAVQGGAQKKGTVGQVRTGIAIAGVTGLQTALDAKAATADLGDLATLDTVTASLVTDFDTAADARIAAASIDDLADVAVDTPAARHALFYDDADARFENRAIEAADLPDLSGTYATQANLATNATNDRARANHTGTQTAATISDFNTAVDGRITSGAITSALGYTAANAAALNASNLTSGTIPDARFPATLPAANGSALTALNASNLGSGTVPDARFPATLPAISGANLTNLDASDLASGTVPDARFPATLPAVNGSALTNLNASALASGTVPLARIASGRTLLMFTPQGNEPPAANFATPDVRNARVVLDFDDTTQEAAIFTGVLPNHYGGLGVTVYLYWATTSATSGTGGWDVAFERIGDSVLDIDSDDFASAQTVTAATVPGTSGHVKVTSAAFTDGAQMDSAAAGELFRLRVRRDVANDNAAGDLELLAVVIKET